MIASTVALDAKHKSAMLRRFDRKIDEISGHSDLGNNLEPFFAKPVADQGLDTRLIQDYLGHRNIQHTVRYTAGNAARFEKLWRQKRS